MQFVLLAGRNPKAKELAILAEAWEHHRQQFAAHPQSAEELLSVGESRRNKQLDAIDLAAYAVVANLIMNLDEFVTRE